jgi:enoyl-CoA hydratase/3-hydroxyacyl-CoA dehydrogenase
MHEVRRIAVLGAGTMGHGIAELAAISGFDVFMYDISEEILSKSRQRIVSSMEKLVQKKRLSEETMLLSLQRIHPTTSLKEAVGDVDLVIEAVPEEIEVKKDIFSKADKIAKENTIFASNTSTLPIGELASSTSRQENFVGMHFFNPPVLMPLVEIIKSDKTSDKAVETAVSVAKKMGKDIIICIKDVPGFIVNRILGPLLNEAAWCVIRGEATIEQIDSMAVYKVGLPMGIFELADFTGIDVIYKASIAVSSRDSSNVLVAPIFKEMYESGKLGQKTGAGFYDYKEKKPAIGKEAGKDVDPLIVFAPSINAASWLLRNGVCTKEDIEKAVKLGLGFPEGILSMADKWGIDKIVETLKTKMEKYGEYYRPDPLLVSMLKEGKKGISSGSGFFDYSEKEKKLETIYIKFNQKVAWIYLNRPQRLNTINSRMIKELRDTLFELETRKDVRVIVITGEGERAFSAGADLLGVELNSQIDIFKMAKEWNEAFSAIEFISKPVIAAINGVALGGGLELALACDFRLASRDAILGLTETRLGLVPGAGGLKRLQRIVGHAKAKEMIMLGERISAEEAERIGLVNRVYGKEEFIIKVEEFASSLSKMPPIALALAKYSLNSHQEFSKAGDFFDSASFSLLSMTKDASEGIQAMFEKREPEFKGE